MTIQLRNAREETFVDERSIKRQKLLDVVRRTISDQLLLEEQRQVLSEYYKHIMAGGTRLKSPYSLRNTFTTLYYLGLFLEKPYNQAKKEDFASYATMLREQGLRQLARKRFKERANVIARVEMPSSLTTIICAFAIIKPFYHWLYGRKECPEVDWMKLTDKRRELPEQNLVSPEDVKLLVEQCRDAQSKTLVMLLWDSATRISEALSLRLSDILFDSYGAQILVDGKTGKRKIRLIYSVPYLQDWLNQHPFKDQIMAPLFISVKGARYGRQMTYELAKDTIARAVKTSKIQKKPTPHTFRHSRLNYLAKTGLNERDLRLFAGWTSTSAMPDTYLHYGYDALDKKLLKQAGKLTAEDEQKAQTEQETLKPLPCSRCKQENPATALFCHCGMALSLRAVMEETEKRDKADAVMNKLFEDEEFKTLLEEYIRKKTDKGKF